MSEKEVLTALDKLMINAMANKAAETEDFEEICRLIDLVSNMFVNVIAQLLIGRLRKCDCSRCRIDAKETYHEHLHTVGRALKNVIDDNLTDNGFEALWQVSDTNRKTAEEILKEFSDADTKKH